MADEIRKEVIVDVKIENADNEKQVDTLTKRITELKTTTEGLVKTNKELEKSGQANSQEYLDNAKQIEINKQKINENTASRKSLITTIISEDKSIKALQVRNKELIKQRNEISTATAGGRAQIAILNKEIDENTNIIRQNSSAHEQQRMNIGNYASALDNLKPGLSSTIKEHAEMFAGLTAGTAVLGGVTAAVGGMFALYAKSVTGARDLAKAQDLLSHATDLAAESFAELVGAATGGTNDIGFFEKLAFAVVAYFDAGTAAASLAATQAKELLRQLEISERFAQAFYKDDERRAELQRRIRDDESRSLEERFAAAKKVEEFMQNAGDMTIVVLQAQIAAIKESTVNFDQNREAQLKVAELEAEIADKREEITGKLTENAMAVKALTAEYVAYAEQQRQMRLETYDAQLEAEHEKYLEEKEIRDQKEADEQDIQDRFLTRLQRETKEREDAAKANTKTMQAESNAFKASTTSKIGMIDMFATAIGNLAGENKALAIAAVVIEKAAAIAGIISNTAIANAKAIAISPVTFGQPWVAINTATGVAAGIAVAAQAATSIAQIGGFAEGGLSGTKVKPYHGTPVKRSNGDNILATVKTGEVILNERQQAALGGPDIFQKIGVPGFADGGFTGAIQTNIAHSRAAGTADMERMMINLIRSLPAPQVAVVDINNGQSQFAEVTDRARL